MGFFSSITSGLGSAVNWVSQSSGSIVNAAAAVAKAAAQIPTTEEEKELMANVPRDDIADLQLNYNKANEYLIQVAMSETPESSLEAGLDAHMREKAVTQSATLSGIWQEPADVHESGNPLVHIVQDVTKFLHQHNMPTTLKVSGAVQDVAYIIAQNVFGGLKSHGVEAGSDLVQHPSFSIKNDDESCIITGCMGYYPIALGWAQDPSQDVTALHAALHVRSSTLHQFRVAQALERRNRCFRADPSQIMVGSCGWLVTLQVAWTSIGIAQQAWLLIKNSLDTQGLEVLFNQQQGNLEVVKILATRHQSPYQVKNAFTVAVSTALAKLTTPPMYINNNSVAVTSTQLPLIEITNSTLMNSTDCADDSRNDSRNDKTANRVQGRHYQAPSRTQSVVRDNLSGVANRPIPIFRYNQGDFSDIGDWTEVGTRVKADMKQVGKPISKRGANSGDCH